MEECEKVIFVDGREELIVEYTIINDIDPSGYVIKFKTETNEYILKPISEEVIDFLRFDANRNRNLIPNVITHSFYVIKNGTCFAANDIECIQINTIPRFYRK